MSCARRRTEDSALRAKQSVHVGEKVFVKLSCGKWTIGEVLSVCEVSDDVKIKFSPTAKLSLPPWVRVHRTERGTFSTASPDWKKDYHLLEMHEQDQRRQNEELARQKRFERLQRVWEEESKERDWSRTWSCKSRKQVLQQHREEVKKRTDYRMQMEQQRQAQIEASRSAARARGAPIVTDSTAFASQKFDLKEQQLADLSKRSSRKEKRFRFDPKQWAANTSHVDFPTIIEQPGHIEAVHDMDSHSITTTSASSLVEVAHYHSSDQDDHEFYLSEEDLPELNGSCSLAFFFQESLSASSTIMAQAGFEAFDHGVSEIYLQEGDFVTVVDEKSGFLRSESGPQRLRLLPTERLVGGTDSSPSAILTQSTQSISII